VTMCCDLGDDRHDEVRRFLALRRSACRRRGRQDVADGRHVPRLAGDAVQSLLPRPRVLHLDDVSNWESHGRHRPIFVQLIDELRQL